MANPSLQIGNSNWAIKEDNLLGYSTAGTRFVPQPITMTRASAGTRVNSSGLVETVELLGSEEVTGFTNGITYPFSTFTTSGSNITSAIISSSFAGAVSNSISIVNGKTYKVTFTYTKNSGDDLRVLISSSVSGAGTSITNIEQVSASGDITLFFTATSTTTGYLQMGTGSGSDSLDISITNISVKESTKNNLARVDYDGTASSLLVEPMRTNLVPYSEDFNSWYAKDYVTVTEDTSETISPSGNNTASKITINSVSTIRRLYEVVTTSSGSDYTFTLYAKKGTTDFIRLLFTSSIIEAEFNLTNGTVTSGTGSIESVGNDWYRLQATGTSSLTGEVPQIQLSSSASVNDYLYIWGCQVEEGSYATSYIPTDGGTVTRVQDQYSKTGISNLINSEEGVLFAEMAALSDDSDSKRITISDGTLTNRITISIASNIISGFINVNNVTQYTFYESGITTTDFNKIAIKYKVNDFAIWINGVEYDVDTSGITFSADTLNTLNFSNATNLSNFFNGKVKQLQVFKIALTDPELIALTS